MSSRLRILALEPYYGGSHRAVLDGLMSRIDADWDVLTLPPRKWKWRMRGAAITMAQQAASLAAGRQTDMPWDVLFVSTFLNLAEFRGLAGPTIGSIPAVVYFHENQLVYPNRHEAEWDLQFPLTNVTSALSAQLCIFNTEWNRTTFLDGIPGFIKGFPDHRPAGLSERIAAHSIVIAPPFDPAPFDAAPITRSGRCRIVWPHRWEHDKNPEEFFWAVEQLALEGLEFEVVVAGQSFRETDALMREAAGILGDRLVHCDEPASRDHYAQLLASADVSVSTALNEFFGLAMIESCRSGCRPLVPDRLAYPEIYPYAFLYHGREELVESLRRSILDRPEVGEARSMTDAYTFDTLVPSYERALRSVVDGR